MNDSSVMNQDLIKETTNDEKPTLHPVAEWALIIVGSFLGAVLLIWIIRKIVQGPSYTKTNRIDGKIVIITGCNTGIGKETALELAKRGAKVYMACRDPVRCEDARLEIVEKSQNQNVFNRTLDLSSLESVQKFTENFLKDESRLDILINNAGVMACPKGFTKDGFEQQFGINHLGHFFLTNLLLDTIKASAPSRIVIVSSAIYILGQINKHDLLSEKSYSKFGAYSQSKLANILFTKYLAKTLHGSDVTVNCCHPGIVVTELARHVIKSRTQTLIHPFIWLFFKTRKAGAQTSLRLALDPDLNKVSGEYFFDGIRCPTLPKARNPEMIEWLMQKSQDLIDSKIKPAILIENENAKEHDEKEEHIELAVEISNDK